MTDKVSSFVLSFDGDAGDLNAVLAAFKKSVQSTVSELKATTAKIELFSGLEDDVQKAAAALADATAKVAAFKTQIDAIKGSGGAVGADLAAQFKLAESAATAASRAYLNQVTQLSSLQSKLTLAGVNTGALASEQLRLADALKVATAAAAQQAAKGLLGFKGIADVQPQITALTNAFNTLRASGTLSSTEISAAQTLLAQKIAQVKAQVTGLGTAFTGQTQTIGSFFTGIQAKVLGFVAVVGTVVAAVKSVTDEARNFNQGLAQIGAVTNLSEADLASLGEEARALARTIGVDVVEAVKQLGVIIAAGIPADNAIAVLATSAEQAKIAQVDLGTEVKLSTTLINAFGVSTDDLNRILSIFFQSAKNGGPAIAAIADDIGKLGPLAKQTGTPIEEISAALQVMVKAGVPAGNAINDLNQLFVKLNTASARKELASLGITTTDLAAQLDAIGKSGVPVGQLLGDLGLSSARSVAGVAALTDGSGKLSAALLAQKDALNVAAKAQAAYANTPKERLELFNAAVHDLSITIGNSIGASSKYAEGLANIINRFNALPPSTRDAAVETLAFGNSLRSVLAVLRDSKTAVADLSDALAKGALSLQSSVAGIRGIVAGQAAAAQQATDAARASFQGFAADLQAQITALQAASTAAIADLNARAAAQIAALDKSTGAEQATADATLAIQTKLATDRLALIVKNNADILAAINDAGAAQLAAVAGNAEKTKAVDLSVAQAKLAYLANYKSQLSAALADSVAQEQGYVGKLNTIDDSRVAFNRDIQQKIDDIRNEGLSGFEQYIAKTDRIKQLLADAQTQFALGGDKAIATGIQYTKDAEDLAVGLKTVVNENGVTVVSALEAQQTKLGFLKTAQNQVNQAFADQAGAVNKGKEASVDAAKAIGEVLADVTKQYDALNAKVKEGIALKITTDTEDIAKAQKAIDDAVEKQRLIKVALDGLDAVKSQVDALIENLKAGVTDGANAQLQSIGDALKKIAASAPELKLDIGPATTLIESLKTSITKIADLKPKVTVDSNIADVQAAKDKLKEPTESTHTIHVVVEGGTVETSTTSSPVSGFARGGVVGSLNRVRNAWRNFSGGGFTFPTLASAKVPGVGNADTVPASLPRGAFVLRKAAVQHYGDGLMSALARVRFLASGGSAGAGFGMNDRGIGIAPPPDPKKLTFFEQFLAEVARQTADLGPTAPAIDPKKGYQPGDSFQGDLPPPATIDTRTVPPSLITAQNVLSYAQEMLLRVGVNNPLLGFLGEDLQAMMKAVEADPTDTAAITQLLRDAETLGTNPGIFGMWEKTARSATQIQPEWFYDWLKQTHAGDLNAALGSSGSTAGTDSPFGSLPVIVNDFMTRFFGSSGFGQLFYTQNPLATIRAVGLAHGGEASGSDTVNAMLTPGEYVISAPRPAEIGADWLHALNDRQFSREDLANILSPPAPRRPMRFAEGGPVGDLWGGSGPKMAGNGDGSNFTIIINTSEKVSTESVRRMITPVINDIQRRSSKS